MTDPRVTATVTVTDEVGSPVSPLIFGAMIEHFGRTVDPGIWDAKRDIPRSDTKAAVEAMGVSALRYPGGCFSDTYHWRDGVGPKSERPLVKETFWTTLPERLGGFGTSSTFASTPDDIGKLVGPPSRTSWVLTSSSNTAWTSTPSPSSWSMSAQEPPKKPRIGCGTATWTAFRRVL